MGKEDVEGFPDWLQTHGRTSKRNGPRNQQQSGDKNDHSTGRFVLKSRQLLLTDQ